MLATISIDGAVISIVRDVIERSRLYPENWTRFSRELEYPSDVPPHVRSIRALNNFYSTGIPESIPDGQLGLRRNIDYLLEHGVARHHRGVLVPTPGIDVAFLTQLANNGANRVKLLTRKYRNDI